MESTRKNFLYSENVTVENYKKRNHTGSRGRPKNVKDYFGKRGCCLTCNDQIKYDLQMRNRITFDVYIAEKYYSCICRDGKCTHCSWYYKGECGRKGIGGDNIW